MKKMKEATFIVTIKDNQHATWQGSVEWVQSRKKENFRSMLELLKLIDSVVEKPDSE